MTTIPALDALGAHLDDALRTEVPRVRRRRRTAVLAGLVAAAVAVPAAGTVTHWAGLAGGETPLPTQVGPGFRVTLAAGSDAGGRWRVEAYAAQLAGSEGRVGVCAFASRAMGGSGRCVAEGRLGPLVIAADGADAARGLAAGVVRAPVARVEITVRSLRDPSTARVVALTPGAAPTSRLAARGLPTDLRSYVLLLSADPLVATGVRALDGAGRTVAVSGRPTAAAPTVKPQQSPYVLLKVSP